MSNDLISRSALIDELKQSGMIVDNDYGNAMVDFIKNLPTAYDVDKVVEQLNERYVNAIGMLRERRGTAYEYPAEIRCGVYKISIRIVKAGGVNVNTTN